MVKVGIAGVTGYGGRELLRLLLAHPHAEVVMATSTTEVGVRVADRLPAFRKLCDLTFEAFDEAALAKKCDVVYVGVPGTESMAPVAALRDAGARVIDLGPDFRLKDTKTFRQYYKTDHTAPALLNESVYGLPPVHRDNLKSAQLVAGPGCYPITAILPLLPLLERTGVTAPIVMDSVSGISGAGRSLKEAYHFPEMNENVWAYKVGVHQHTPEIEQEIGHRAFVQFTPHVGPYTRGILTTLTVRPSRAVDLAECYARYEREPFVRVLGEGNLPELKNVRASNFCDFGWVNDERTGNIVIVSAIDNLLGGTAGIAVQCMNIMFGIEETAGLIQAGVSV